jgi:hypothetical protein
MANGAYNGAPPKQDWAFVAEVGNIAQNDVTLVLQSILVPAFLIEDQDAAHTMWRGLARIWSGKRRDNLILLWRIRQISRRGLNSEGAGR